MENITAYGDAVFIANNSVDMGNNTGWNIQSSTPRKLFWVGGTGDWNNPAHWSLNENGSGGGQCPPSSVDDVFFNEHSFSDSDTLRVTTSVVFCHDMDWRSSNNNVVINNKEMLRIYGSLWLQENVKFQGSKEISFLSKNSSEILSSAKVQTPLLRFKDRNSFWQIKGELHCKSSLLFYGEGSRYELGGAAFISGSLSHQYGSFITNNYPIDCQFFYVGHNADSLFLGSSQITLSHKNFVVYNDDTYIDGGTSVIHMKNSASVFINKGQRFYNVIFEDTTENTQELKGPGSYNHVKFNSNGIIEDNNSFDSLSFAAGCRYNIGKGKTQVLNKYFLAKGNSCHPIVIFAQDSSIETFHKESGVVSGDFLELHYVKAGGGAEFFAGTYTDDYSETSPGWIFENAPGYIYGLGNDTVMCKGELLETYNFNGAKSYLWHDGSTNAFYEVKESGMITVAVFYDEDCIYYDTINVQVIDNAILEAGEDIFVCHPNTPISVNVDIQEGVQPYEIEWEPKTGIDKPDEKSIIIKNDVSEQYIITVTSRNLCEARDTVNYYVIQTLVPKIYKDGDYLVSNIPIGNQWYLDGEPIPGAVEDRIIPFETGEYTVIVTIDDCRSLTSEKYFFYEAVKADIVIVVGSAKAEPGEEVNIPINIINQDSLLSKNITSFDAILSYNARILYSDDLNSSATFSGDYASIPVELNYNASEDKWGEVHFTAMLGNTDKCGLALSSISGIGDTIKVGIINGLFELDEICLEGGKRLFDDSNRFFIMQSAPNPASYDLKLVFGVIDDAEVELSLVNLLGKEEKILDKVKLKPGLYEKIYDITHIPAGFYLCTMKTAGRCATKRVVVLK